MSKPKKTPDPKVKASPALIRLVDEFLGVTRQIQEIESKELKELKALGEDMKSTIKKQMAREKIEVVSTDVGFAELAFAKGSFKYDEAKLKTALGVEDLSSYGTRKADTIKLFSGFSDTEEEPEVEEE